MGLYDAVDAPRRSPVVAVFGRWVLVVVLAAGVGAPVQGAQAATPRPAARCQGQVATIVGTPGQRTVRGTRGDDVIVSVGSEEVAAGRGDDVVCLTDRSGDEGDDPWVVVEGGPGDDHISASLGGQSLLFVSLGLGADFFTGGRESDIVAGGPFDADDEHAANDSDTDVIDTGAAGFDSVVVGDGGPLTDRVTVHASAAHVEAHTSGLSGEASFTGGPRSTLTVVDESAGAAGMWSLDLATRTAGLSDVPSLSWTGFGRFVWAVPGTVDVQGTGAADVVTGPLVSGDLGAGDDEVFSWSSRADHGTHAAPLSGGTGNDRVRFFAGSVFDDAGGAGGGVVPFTPTDVSVDVSHQRTTFGSGQVVHIGGFEWYGAQTDRVATLVGSSRDDVLFGSACDLRMRGGAGADRLRQVPNIHSAGFSNPSCRGGGGGRVAHLSGGAGDDSVRAAARRGTLMGGAGDDVLAGSGGRDQLFGAAGDDRLLGASRADVLVGGDGRDLARGGPGPDRCHVEYGSGCEYPRSATHLDPTLPGPRPRTARLSDPAGDVGRVDRDRPRDATPAPEVLVGDVVALRTAYRHRQVVFRARFRSLSATDPIRVGVDFRYSGADQFRYGYADVVVPPRGRARVKLRTDEGRCPARLHLDRGEAVITVAFDPSCLGGARWVRAAVRSVTTGGTGADASFTVDAAPDDARPTQRYGPKAWSRARPAARPSADRDRREGRDEHRA